MKRAPSVGLPDSNLFLKSLGSSYELMLKVVEHIDAIEGLSQAMDLLHEVLFYRFTADGIQTDFTGTDDYSHDVVFMDATPQVFVDGVLQDPSAYIVDTINDKITFLSPPENGKVVYIAAYGINPGDGTFFFSPATATTAIELILTQAGAARDAAQTAQGLAETAQTAAEAASTAAQTARTGAETAQSLATIAQTGSQTARTAAEAAQVASETARDASQVSAAAAAQSAIDANAWVATNLTPLQPRIADSDFNMNGWDITGGATFFATDWFSSSGDTGWISETYGGGIYMTDTTWVRVFGAKAFYVANEIAATGNVTAYYSDMRLKNYEGYIDNAVAKVEALDAFYYTENELAKVLGYNSGKRQVALSAQQVQAVMPEAVSLAPFDMATLDDGSVVSKSGEDYLTVDYARLVPLLVAAIQEQQIQIKNLEARLGV